MRDYDPTTGRYIQADPLGLVDGASVYGYALQNPVVYSDPSGLFRGTPPPVRPAPLRPGISPLYDGGSDPGGMGSWPQAGEVIPFPGGKSRPPGGGGNSPPNDNENGSCGSDDKCYLDISVTAEQAEGSGVYPGGTNLAICVYWCPETSEHVKQNMSAVIQKTMGCPPTILPYKSPVSYLTKFQVERLRAVSRTNPPPTWTPIRPVE